MMRKDLWPPVTNNATKKPTRPLVEPPVGLVNVGNTCYADAALQVFNHLYKLNGT